MPFLTVDGADVLYEVRGEGPTVVLVSGGMSPGGAMMPLAERLADRFQVITWDRPNQGGSHVRFDGNSELELSARALAALIQHVGSGVALLIGASEGTRAIARTALRYPDRVAGMFLWQISAGETGAPWMRDSYYLDYARLAEDEGMLAVTRTAWWGERIKFNLSNRERLLSTDPSLFARAMRSWADEMDGSLPIYGHTDDDLRQIAVPAWIVAGVDPWHSEESSRRVAELLPNAQYLPAPYDGSDFDDVKEVWDGVSNVFVRYADLPGIPQLIDRFVAEIHTPADVR